MEVQFQQYPSFLYKKAALLSQTLKHISQNIYFFLISNVALYLLSKSKLFLSFKLSFKSSCLANSVIKLIIFSACLVSWRFCGTAPNIAVIGDGSMDIFRISDKTFKSDEQKVLSFVHSQYICEQVAGVCSHWSHVGSKSVVNLASVTFDRVIKLCLFYP